MAATAVHRLRRIGIATSAARLNAARMSDWLESSPLVRWMRRQGELIHVLSGNWAINLLRGRRRGHPLKWQILWACAWQADTTDAAVRAFVGAAQNQQPLTEADQAALWPDDEHETAQLPLPADVSAAFAKHATLRDVAEELGGNIGAVQQWLVDYPALFNGAISADDIVDFHSHVPMYASFMTALQAFGWRERLTGGAPGRDTIAMGLRHMGAIEAETLRKCPTCVREDQAQFGCGHWRIFHQWPVARHCVVHGDELATYCAECKTPLGRGNNPSLADDACVNCGGYIHALPARGSQTNYFYQFAGNNQGFLPDWFKQPGSGRLGTAYHDQYGATLSAPATNTEIGLSNELVPASLRPFTTPNLGAALIQAGLSFATFSEGLPHPLFDDKTFTPTGAKDGYARRHNPAINWINFPSLNASVPADKQRFLLPVASNLAMVATTDTNGVKYPGFGWDKDGKTAPFEALPTVSIVVPTNDDNIHTGSKAAADAWLKTYIKPYADWARANDGLLIITTDEDGFTDSSNGSTTVSYDALIKQAIPGTTGSYMYGMDRIATLFHGPANRIKAGSYSQRIDHLNVLATVLGMYGVLDQFKADFEARHTATTDAIRIKEAKSQVANLTPITAMLV